MDTTQKMNVQQLPNELLLSIIEVSNLTFPDLIRLRTIEPFRGLLQEPRRVLAERLFLRTLNKPRPWARIILDLTVTIKAVTRKGKILYFSHMFSCFVRAIHNLAKSYVSPTVPRTIWNNYNSFYDLTWHIDTDDPIFSSVNGPLNPVLRNIGKYMDLVNGHFKHHSPYERAAPGEPQPPRSLRFRDLDELEQLVAFGGNVDASVRNMLISLYPLRSLQILGIVLRRYGARRCKEHSRLINVVATLDKNKNMRAFFKTAGEVLKLSRHYLDEDSRGNVAPSWRVFLGGPVVLNM
ncbi:hypothetical protein FB567DRAFT_36959 [Paraphoma chrysanthemicola]|uniref:Uncharacterized protein n=1 Tax=Paraphoma chrysanthemicola TaxID=798071 RepID=A0A8K0RJ23_9PLEO|nr:hypothetical protein FB567DRAFT_36959 [Paraphoma chrysanthemicola]